jgi:hypothetical protein
MMARGRHGTILGSPRPHIMWRALDGVTSASARSRARARHRR